MGLWLARDKDGKLNVFRTKPRLSKLDGKWFSFTHSDAVLEDTFPEVTFENSPVELVPKIEKGGKV